MDLGARAIKVLSICMDPHCVEEVMDPWRVSPVQKEYHSCSGTYMEVGLSYCCQNAENYFREPYDNRNHAIRTRIIAIWGHSP